MPANVEEEGTSGCLLQLLELQQILLFISRSFLFHSGPTRPAAAGGGKVLQDGDVADSYYLR